MKPRFFGHKFLLPAICVTWVSVLASGPAIAQPNECPTPCGAPSNWFPITPKPTYSKPNPDLDCDFYKFAWQTLLYITQEDSDGSGPRLLLLQTKDELFSNQPVSRFPKSRKGMLSLAPRLALHRGPLSSSDIVQAGSQGIVVDRFGKSVYYAIHLNDVFSEFIRKHEYTDFVKLKLAPADQEFPRGSLEIKSSWRVIADDEPASVTDNYFVTQAVISRLKLNAAKKIEVDSENSYVSRVALLGIHVVGVVDGHPEFIWATFEHKDNSPDGSTADIPDMINSSGRKNLANQDPSKAVDAQNDFTMYKKGALAKDCNLNRRNELVLDEKTQTITGQKSIFRVFPFGGDDEPCTIETLNESVHDQIRKQQANLSNHQYAKLKVWTNYRLKGAIWLNNPAYFRENVDFVALAEADTNIEGSAVRLISWGDGTGVPTSGNKLVIVGSDNNKLLHIRVFNGEGKLVTDADEKSFIAQAGMITSLKQQLPDLLPPHVLTFVEQAQVISEVKSIVGQNAKKILGGDIRLSNSTMESYTQGTVNAKGDVQGIQSCFHCHRTVVEPSDRINNRSFAKIHFPAKRIGVSHILTGTYFLSHEEFNVQTQKNEDKWRKAVVTNDSNQISMFLSDDFVFVDSDRRTSSRERYLSDFNDGTLKITAMEFTKDLTSTDPSHPFLPWTIDVYESVAIVAFAADIKGTKDGKEISGTYQVSDTFIKLQGRWMAVSREQSMLK